MMVGPNATGALVVGIVVGLAVGVLLAALYFLWWRMRYTRMVRLDAVQRSQAVTAGKVYEQLVPYLPDFPFNPKDVRFLGAPVDLVVFDGLSDGAVRRIVFVEVKTAASDLSTRERRVRDAVRAGRVEWSELRVGGSVA
jgi:predicted Holliday junction resolvase-like endonuclease